MSETTLFRAWHPDALEYYNKCGASLRSVFDTMTDPSKDFATVRADAAVGPGRATLPSARWPWDGFHSRFGGLVRLGPAASLLP